MKPGIFFNAGLLAKRHSICASESGFFTAEAQRRGEIRKSV